MIVGVVRADRDLLAEAEGQAKAARFAGGIVNQRNAAKNDSRRCEDGNVAIGRSALEET